jgi:hypothetical protein
VKTSTSGRREVMGKWVHMNINANMILVETTPGIGGGRNKGRMVEGVNSCTISLVHCKNLQMLQCTPTQHNNKGKN